MSITHQVDFLVIGSGVAGLSYALRVAEHGSVAVITKKASAESNTNYAQGGIAAVIDPDDSFEDHIQDTLIAGAGLCSRQAVEIVVTEGPSRVMELMEMGAEFSRKNGKLDLGREGGHSANRIIHAADTTGREVERALLANVNANPNIELLQYHFALELITEHHLGQTVNRHSSNIHCFGAYVLNEETQKVEKYLAKTTLLAAGGAGQVYLHTTNPSIATGDGIAMAYRAKARIANMEFIQFHPTSLFHPDASSFLISEAVRGAGGLLFNAAGDRFMPEYDERAELAPRDIVARAIDAELKKSGGECVYLDISHEDHEMIHEHFPHIAATCKKFGIDIYSQPIPVVPAAHYTCGGVITDVFGRTTVNGLFACGEVSCTGLHGANRLASNSLLEALVFSKRAIEPSIEYARTAGWEDNIPDWDDSGTERPDELILISHNKEELQRVMWDYVGIVRSTLRLNRALRRTRLLFDEAEEFYTRTRVSSELAELRNLIAVGYMIIQSALKRQESRGLHYMTDFPETLDKARFDTLM